jgi:transcription initiation factor TFIIB
MRRFHLSGQSPGAGHNRQSDRHKRLNEGFRDVRMFRANLELPDHVTTDAAHYLEAAKDERLPGGRMAWESLAAGAVLIAGRASSVERTPAQIVQFPKSSRERVCEAPRKTQLQTPVDAPVVRVRAVDRVVTALGETGIDGETGIELVRFGERLLDVADTVPIGPGTARMTVAGAAVYAADRLTPGKAVT